MWEDLRKLAARGAALVLLAAALAPSGYGCEMCKNAVASDGHNLALGINTSVIFMIAMVFTVLFSFLGLLWWTCRREQSKEARGTGFSPAGKVRWSADDIGPL